MREILPSAIAAVTDESPKANKPKTAPDDASPTFSAFASGSIVTAKAGAVVVAEAIRAC